MVNQSCSTLARNLPMTIDLNTPIIVGVGEFTQRLGDDLSQALSPQQLALSPQQLAVKAAKAAINDAQSDGMLKTIDAVVCTRPFYDSVPLWQAPFGKTDNMPGSVAKGVGINANQLVYASVGGNTPQALVNEWCEKLYMGQASMVLLAGTEAIASTNHALKQGVTLDWAEHIDQPFEDRPLDIDDLLDQHLLQHLLMTMPANYALCEVARMAKLGQDVDSYTEQMAQLMAPMVAVAKANPYSMFDLDINADQIASTDNRNGYVAWPYTRAMVAKDGVNQAAALVLTTVGKAQELGISESKWVYLRGYAEAKEKPLLSRADLATSPAMTAAYQQAMLNAAINPNDLKVIDIYSCFPIVVSEAKAALAIEHLDHPMTETGGLSFFGGPGNNYSMHGIAAVVRKLRADPLVYGLVGANGGVMSKHAVGIYSCQAGFNICNSQTIQQRLDAVPDVKVNHSPSGRATIESYTIHYDRGQPSFAIVVGALNQTGERFIANGPDGDTSFLNYLVEANRVGAHIEVGTSEQGNRCKPVDTASLIEA